MLEHTRLLTICPLLYLNPVSPESSDDYPKSHWANLAYTLQVATTTWQTAICSDIDTYGHLQPPISVKGGSRRTGQKNKESTKTHRKVRMLELKAPLLLSSTVNKYPYSPSSSHAGHSIGSSSAAGWVYCRCCSVPLMRQLLTACGTSWTRQKGRQAHCEVLWLFDGRKKKSILKCSHCYLLASERGSGMVHWGVGSKWGVIQSDRSPQAVFSRGNRCDWWELTVSS